MDIISDILFHYTVTDYVDGKQMTGKKLLAGIVWILILFFGVYGYATADSVMKKTMYAVMIAVVIAIMLGGEYKKWVCKAKEGFNQEVNGGLGNTCETCRSNCNQYVGTPVFEACIDGCNETCNPGKDEDFCMSPACW
jgi:hypothetical protein